MAVSKINAPTSGALQVAGVDVVTWDATGLTAPLHGVIDGSNASAGIIGEHITNTGTGVSLTNNTSASVTTISLTAGDWEVSGEVAYNYNGTTSTTSFGAAINTSVGLPAAPLFSFVQMAALIPPNTSNLCAVAPSQRISISATTTIYLIAFSGFTLSTLTATGTIRARRVR